MGEETNFISRAPLSGESEQEYNKFETERLLSQASLIKSKYETNPKLKDKLPKILKEYKDVEDIYNLSKYSGITITTSALDNLKKEYLELSDLDIKESNGMTLLEQKNLNLFNPNNSIIRKVELDIQLQNIENFSISNQIRGKNINSFRKAGLEAYNNLLAGKLTIKSDESSLKEFANFLSYLVLEKGEGRPDKLEQFVKILKNDTPEILKIFQENWGEGKTINRYLRNITDINKKFTTGYQFKELGGPIKEIMKFKTKEVKRNVNENFSRLYKDGEFQNIDNKNYTKFLQKIEKIPDRADNSVSQICKAIKDTLGISDPTKIIELYTRISKERLDKSISKIDTIIGDTDTGKIKPDIIKKYELLSSKIRKSDIKTFVKDKQECSIFIAELLKQGKESGNEALIKLAKGMQTYLDLAEKHIGGKVALVNKDAQGTFISSSESQRKDSEIMKSLNPSIENEGIKLTIKDNPKAKGVLESLNLGVQSVDELLNNEELLNKAIIQLSNKTDKSSEEIELLNVLQKFANNRKEEKRQYVIAVNNLNQDQINDFESKGKSLGDLYDKSKQTYESKILKENGIVFTNSAKSEQILTEAKIGDTISMGTLSSNATITKKTEGIFELKLYNKTYEYSKEEIPHIGASIEYMNSLGLGFLLQDLKLVEKLFNENSVKIKSNKEGLSFNLSDENGFSRDEKFIFLKILGEAIFDKEKIEKANSPEALESIFIEANYNNKTDSLARNKGILDKGGNFKFGILENLVKSN
ncbi:MAG: hypothetical protein PHZ26_05070 [Candidatus Gracilibacteria bacterium]|nr:hypothetical protein [Candidatus Gracilibacteria bacterium]MDD2909089.1 hypothetical protein [Candidatus Gracilibacteria bacterium]